MALRIENDRVVKLAYRITDNEGRVLDERTPEQAYEYLHGRGQIVAPVERVLEGKTAGFTAEVSVAPRDAYGEYQTSLVAELPRSHFPKNVDIKVGMKFSTEGQNAQSITVRVTSVEKDVVTIDGNHPLAGIDLIFDLKVLDVREATADEIENGRAGEVPSVDLATSDKGSGTLH